MEQLQAGMAYIRWGTSKDLNAESDSGAPRNFLMFVNLSRPRFCTVPRYFHLKILDVSLLRKWILHSETRTLFLVLPFLSFQRGRKGCFVTYLLLYACMIFGSLVFVETNKTNFQQAQILELTKTEIAPFDFMIRCFQQD